MAWGERIYRRSAGPNAVPGGRIPGAAGRSPHPRRALDQARSAGCPLGHHGPPPHPAGRGRAAAASMPILSVHRETQPAGSWRRCRPGFRSFVFRCSFQPPTRRCCRGRPVCLPGSPGAVRFRRQCRPPVEGAQAGRAFWTLPRYAAASGWASLRRRSVFRPQRWQKCRQGLYFTTRPWAAITG